MQARKKQMTDFLVAMAEPEARPVRAHRCRDSHRCILDTSTRTGLPSRGASHRALVLSHAISTAVVSSGASSQVHIHEYQITQHSLYAAASMGIGRCVNRI